ncbi:MAG: haloacid dehalogenase type II [Thiolinea sp.]
MMADTSRFALAFDVYGTLIDTHGVVTALSTMVGDQAPAFSQTWRDKQLEYSFRRGLQKDYQHFGICTRDALEYTCLFYQCELSTAQKDELLALYRVLPAFADVTDALAQLKQADIPMYAFSNGNAAAVEGLLQNAGIREYFAGVVSVDDLQTFKPNPEVYQHFLTQSGATAEKAWLISSNPFDVIGAVGIGMQAAWVKRSKTAIFDPWGVEPTATVSGLHELPALFTTE